MKDNSSFFSSFFLDYLTSLPLKPATFSVLCKNNSDYLFVASVGFFCLDFSWLLWHFMWRGLCSKIRSDTRDGKFHLDSNIRKNITKKTGNKRLLRQLEESWTKFLAKTDESEVAGVSTRGASITFCRWVWINSYLILLTWHQWHYSL